MAVSERNTVDVPFLESFCAAFNRHDLDAVMAHMTEDCVFTRSSGPDADGQRCEGQAATRAGFESVMSVIRNIHFEPLDNWVCGDRGVSEWTLTGDLADGSRFEARGVDVFHFRDGKIAVKDSYVKRRG